MFSLLIILFVLTSIILVGFIRFAKIRFISDILKSFDLYFYEHLRYLFY